MRRDHDETANGTAVPSRSERLEYMADMILEMEFMARRSGYSALANFLRGAHEETARQMASNGR